MRRFAAWQFAVGGVGGMAGDAIGQGLGMAFGLPGSENGFDWGQMFASGLGGGFGGAASYRAMRAGMQVCFAAGTPLRTPGRWRYIEDLRAGDLAAVESNLVANQHSGFALRAAFHVPGYDLERHLGAPDAGAYADLLGRAYRDFPSTTISSSRSATSWSRLRVVRGATGCRRRLSSYSTHPAESAGSSRFPRWRPGGSGGPNLPAWDPTWRRDSSGFNARVSPGSPPKRVTTARGGTCAAGWTARARRAEATSCASRVVSTVRGCSWSWSASGRTCTRSAYPWTVPS